MVKDKSRAVSAAVGSRGLTATLPGIGAEFPIALLRFSEKGKGFGKAGQPRGWPSEKNVLKEGSSRLGKMVPFAIAHFVFI